MSLYLQTLILDCFFKQLHFCTLQTSHVVTTEICTSLICMTNFTNFNTEEDVAHQNFRHNLK